MESSVATFSSSLGGTRASPAATELSLRSCDFLRRAKAARSRLLRFLAWCQHYKQGEKYNRGSVRRELKDPKNLPNTFLTDLQIFGCETLVALSLQFGSTSISVLGGIRSEGMIASTFSLTTALTRVFALTMILFSSFRVVHLTLVGCNDYCYC
jgi:hypothetical protein